MFVTVVVESVVAVVFTSTVVVEVCNCVNVTVDTGVVILFRLSGFSTE